MGLRLEVGSLPSASAAAILGEDADMTPYPVVKPETRNPKLETNGKAKADQKKRGMRRAKPPARSKP
jgi:hypothetical protein